MNTVMYKSNIKVMLYINKDLIVNKEVIIVKSRKCLRTTKIKQPNSCNKYEVMAYI